MTAPFVRRTGLACLALLLAGAIASAAPSTFPAPPTTSPFDDSGAGAAAGGGGMMVCACVAIIWLFAFAVAGVSIASLWVIFTKAGKPGWASLVPIYNLFVLVEIVEKPMLFFILCLIPCVQIAMIFIIYIELAKKFGKDPLFGVGMALLPIIFLPMLAFGKAQYLGTGQMPPS